MIKGFNWAVPALVVVTLATPALSQNKEADIKYCNALSDAYKKSHGQTHGMKTTSVESLETTKALDGCKTGDEAKSIPTLEKHLTELKVGLPVR